jgi:heat shock protein HslJ
MKPFMPFLACIFFILPACSPKLSPDSYWGSKRWVVVEMKEVPVQQSGGRQDAYVEFFPSEKRFTGNGGCNRINGNYSMDKRSEMHFTDIVSTKMSCPDIAFETTFLATLADINRFEMLDGSMLLKDDNKVLLILQPR